MAEDKNLFCYQITEELDGDRIDHGISVLMENLSRSYIQKLLKDSLVLANGVPVKPSYRLKEGDEISFQLPDMLEPAIVPENIPLSILYEDADLLLVNKPKGMVVHPAAGHYSGTLVNGIMYHCKDSLSGINGVLRPGIVHRIDRDTTGSLIICKNDTAHRAIADQLKDHSIKRIYHALCYGTFKETEGTVSKPLGRDLKDRKKMACREDGKRAVTHYKLLYQGTGFAYIECRLETGRTHQIRVHMASLGHPLLGDEVYGIEKINKIYKNLQGQCLHAKTIGFIHPRTGTYMEFDTELPLYFQELLRKGGYLG